MIIVVANSKGGVGKSTLAVHLAAWLHEQGHSVTLADCDTQHSSSEWVKEAVPESRPSGSPTPTKSSTSCRLGKKRDYVVADGPGSNTETSRALLLRADLALVPCKASMLEVRALAQATKVLRQAQDIRGGQPAGDDRAQHGRQELPADPGHEGRRRGPGTAAGQDRVTLKQIYADAPGQGAVVWHLGARAREAADEVGALFREMLPDAWAARPGENRTPRRQAARKPIE